MNEKVLELINKGVSQRTAYRRVGHVRRGIIPEVKAFILHGYSRSYAYRKYKKEKRAKEQVNGNYAFSTGEFV